MNYDKLMEDLKEMEVNLNMLHNRLQEEVKEDNMVYDIAQIVNAELYKTYRHIQQLLFLIDKGGKMVIKPICD